MAYVDDGPLSDSSIWKVKFLLADCGEDSIAETVLTAFVQSIGQHTGKTPQDRTLLTEARDILKETAHLHHVVVTVLLEYLRETRNVEPFLDVLPVIFSSQDPTVVLDLAKVLLEIDEDAEQFASILDIIVSLPASKELLAVTSRALRSVIGVYPPHLDLKLLRVTLNAHPRMQADLARLWQQRVSGYSLDALAPIVQGMLSATGKTEALALAWLDLLFLQRATLHTFSKMATADACLVLLALSGAAGGVAQHRARTLIRRFLDLRAFPFAAVEEIVVGAGQSSRGGSQVWTKLQSSCWSACLLVLEHLGGVSASLPSGASTGVSGNHVTRTAQLIERLYRVAPPLRETIATAMLTHCFPQSVAAQAPLGASIDRRGMRAGSKHNESFGLPPLRPIGETKSADAQQDGAEESGHYRHSKLQRRLAQRSSATRKCLAYRRASLAVTVLEVLCVHHVTARDAVLRVLFNRLTQQVAESSKVLPSVGILRRLLSCGIASNGGAAQYTQQTTQSQATVMIMIQKLLGTIAPGTGPSLFSTLFATGPGNRDALLHSAGEAFQALQRARLMRRLPPTLPLQTYSGATLGAMLAGQVLLQRQQLLAQQQSSHDQDSQAVLGFLCRQPAFNDLAGVYTLDALCGAAVSVVTSRTAVQTTSSSGTVAAATVDGADRSDPVTLQLMKVIEKVAHVFGVCSSSNDESREFERCDIALQDSSELPREVAPTAAPFTWQVAGLCAQLVQSCRMLSALPTTITTARVRHVTLEVTEACWALFYLCNRLALARPLVSSASGATVVRLSFPRGHADAELGLDTGRRARKGTGGASSARVEGQVPQLDIELSQQLLFTWSSAAADAFVGDFVLPASLSVEQALMLAWERGILVAVLAGTVDRQSSAELLRLVCQVHCCRTMLRAAHTAYIYNRHGDRLTARASPTRSSAAVAGSKRKLASPGRGAGKGENRLVGFASHRSPPRSRSRAMLSPSKHSTASMQAEFAADLQHIQRVALQRLLTRTVTAVPYEQLLSTVERLAAHSSLNRSGGSNFPVDHLSTLLLSDAGLAVVSQLCHRIELRRTDAEALLGLDVADSFVPLQTSSAVSYTHSRDGADRSEQEVRAVRAVLTQLPALLDWIEYTRTHPDVSPTPGLSRSHATDPQLAAQAGGALDRHGCKVLALNMTVLLEWEILSWSIEGASTLADGASSRCGATKLAGMWKGYEEQVQQETSFSSIPVAAAASQESQNENLAASEPEQALRTHCSSVATVYNCLERRLFQQHDCTLVTAGMRCLHHLLPQQQAQRQSGDGSDASLAKAPATERTATVAWGCMRAFYPEHTQLALHLHGTALPGEDIPGMDENWSALARAATAQPALQVAVQEVEQCLTKKTAGVSKLLQSCFSTKRDIHTGKGGSASVSTALQEEQLAAASYRQFWLCWWAAERPSERIYGVANLLRDVIKTIYLEEDRPVQPASSKRKRSRMDSSDHSDSDDESVASEAPPEPAAGSGRRKRYGAPEQMLTKDYSASNREHQQKFPHLTGTTIVFHLELTLPLLPALFLLGKPSSRGVTASKQYSPYEAHNHSAMLFVWAVERWLDILTDHHEQLRLLLQVTPMLVKMFRGALPAIEAAVERAAQWRNAQPEPVQDLHSAPVVDVGSISFFKVMVNWAHRCAQVVRDFCECFRDTVVLPGALQISASLQRDVPAIVKQAEHVLGRLNTVATAHSFTITAPRSSTGVGSNASSSKGVVASTSAVLSRVGDEVMHARMVSFLARHHGGIVTPLQSEALLADVLAQRGISRSGETTGVLAGAGAGGGAELPQAGYESDHGGYVSDEELEFAAWTGSGAQSGGWGLYGNDDAEDGLQSSGTPTSASESHSLAEYSLGGSIGTSEDVFSGSEEEEYSLAEGDDDLGGDGELVGAQTRQVSDLDAFDLDFDAMEE